jgi:phage terminase large subunit
MFVRTTAINKLKELDKFVKGVQGGSSAGKTFGIIPIEINYAVRNPNTETSIVAESIPHLKRGAMRDFIKIMQWTGRWNPSRWNATDFKYTFANGSFIEFFSADTDSKLRGARRDRLYMNEANNMSFHAYTELVMRTKESVFLDWNPTNEFWFHTELQGDSNVDFIILTYLDNEAAPINAVDFIKRAKDKSETSKYWLNWYTVYGLGQVGSLEGVIFNNWNQIGNVPKDAELLGYGMDFGFTNDPTTLIALYRYDSKLLFQELIYRTGMITSDIIRELKRLEVGIIPIFGDSAEPKTIEEIRRAGFNIKPVEKGPDSVKFGLDILQEYDMLVTSDSINLIKELRSYVWDTDKTGKTLNKPIDAYNHCIDAARYAGMMLLKRNKTFNFAI